MSVAGGDLEVGLHMCVTGVPGAVASTRTVDLVHGHGTGDGRATLLEGQGPTAGHGLVPSLHTLEAKAKAGTDRPTRSSMKVVRSLVASRRNDPVFVAALLDSSERTRFHDYALQISFEGLSNFSARSSQFTTEWNRPV